MSNPLYVTSKHLSASARVQLFISFFVTKAAARPPARCLASEKHGVLEQQARSGELNVVVCSGVGSRRRVRIIVVRPPIPQSIQGVARFVWCAHVVIVVGPAVPYLGASDDSLNTKNCSRIHLPAHHPAQLPIHNLNFGA